ncbi:hypothetical protein VH12019_00231 [Vibrio phage VH1_2019]|uniref:Uncharacterized protein n=1 Tax=Vibrio phage VH1_2019 TaxID=2686307 RepID=A0A6B9SUQ6_9CAUD|nr:hypothetical protein VH12019_00231 [Vibrio phage VH1_2019]
MSLCVYNSRYIHGFKQVFNTNHTNISNFTKTTNTTKMRRNFSASIRFYRFAHTKKGEKSISPVYSH